MTGEPRIRVEVRPMMMSSRIEVRLTGEEVADYLECTNDQEREDWMNAHAENIIDRACPDIDYWDYDVWEVFDIPNPDIPAVHPDQMTIHDVLEEAP